MVITLTGNNGFGLGAEIGRLVATFAAEHGDLALERVDAEEADLPSVQAALSSLPLLATQKLLILRAPSKNKAFMENFEQLLSDIPEEIEVILIEPRLDKRQSYYKYLKTKTDFREFTDLDANGLARWLVDMAKQGGGNLTLADAQHLVERTGADQQLLANELEKLLIYSPDITRETIDLLVEPTPSSTVFQLLEAAFAGNSKKTLNLYAEQRAQKVEPQQIMAMLSWQLHILALIKTAGNRSSEQVATDNRLNPYVVRKSQAIARNRSLGDVTKLINALLAIDLKSKSTSVDADEALQAYLLEITSQATS